MLQAIEFGSVLAQTADEGHHVGQRHALTERMTSSPFRFAVYRPRSSFFRFDIRHLRGDHPVPKGVSQETVPRGIGSVENHAVVSFRPFPIF